MERDTRKNLLDLEYNTKLNSLNIFLVLIGTAIISIILSSINLSLKKFGLGFLSIGIVLISWYYHSTLNRIKEQIRNI